MAKKLTAWKTKGMNQDLSVSAFNPEFAFENMNLRLATNEGNTLMSWVNERGTASINIIDSEAEPQSTLQIKGTPIGTAVLNHRLVIFTTGDEDCIYVLKYNSDKTALLGKLLYHGSLNFRTDYPIETLVSYESELIQKVYWTDNLNQPRMINIVSDTIKEGVDTQFDFISELQLNETIKVQKMLGATGMFAPGVIQYAFTYYTKYGQESNIFYTTPLYYISHKDRGASPEDKVENAFKITVENVDTNFDYLRIYSIQRTSINGTPIVKRIQDIEIEGLTDNTASYLDTGFSGNTVDPTELLYKGGDTIVCKTMEQKDGTLFLGGLQAKRGDEELELRKIVEKIKDSLIFSPNYRTIYPSYKYEGFYSYANQLTAFSDVANTISVPCAGFKYGDYYRFGVQFQNCTGKWSDPIYIKDVEMIGTWEDISTSPHTTRPFRPMVDLDSNNKMYIKLPVIDCTISAENLGTDDEPFYPLQEIEDLGYIKIRPVVVYPEMQDRMIICQGVVNSTLYTENHRKEPNGFYPEATHDLYAQSSWFFRVNQKKIDGIYDEGIDTDGTVAPLNPYNNILWYTNTHAVKDGESKQVPDNFRKVEIQGSFSLPNMFKTDINTLTFHSPDVEFDDNLSVLNFTDVNFIKVGDAEIQHTVSDIDIQTESPTVSQHGGGFTHRAFSKSGAYGIVSGLFYDDFIVDDADDTLKAYIHELSPCKWMVYPWHRTGSLNNDINRPADKGTPTAVLKKKIMSNLRFAKTDYSNEEPVYKDFNSIPQLFASDEVSITKLKEGFYKGNIDTLLNPDAVEPFYFCHNSPNIINRNIITPFNSNWWWKVDCTEPRDETVYHNIFRWATKTGQSSYSWHYINDEVGETYSELGGVKGGVRMKYKSTPHLIFTVPSNSISWAYGSLPILEIVRGLKGAALDDFLENTIFGGTSQDALRENTWIPCGEPKRLDDLSEILVDGVTKRILEFQYSYGDTYYQRWDCLKTYAFTPEDINQVVEIGSFMLETRTNIDGRYDRNRAQSNNLYMSPQNFNLLNPVYSQLNNFFSYKIMDEDSYKDNFYLNQITWTKTKNAGADVDQWTNITMASVLELDGDKGEVNKLVRFNNFLFAFQDTGISQIMYNDNVQISATDGVPIEIANSGKVSGKDYKSNTIGCSNKWSMVQTPNGIYFMDSNDKSIYLFNGQLQNMSSALGFNSWAKNEIPAMDVKWNPVNFGAETADDKSTFMACFDKKNQDVLFINNDKALAYSEKLSGFTSFYDYGSTPFFCNLDDVGIWIRTDGTLWKHQGGDYCRFFGHNKPYWMTLVGNPEPQMDKIFTNLEFRASVEGDGKLDDETGKFTPALPFDSLETWNEYQHGYTTLDNKSGHSLFKHGGDSSTLIRKFRIWRSDIPRNNCLLGEPEEGQTWPYSTDEELGVSRHIRKPQDRMRNPWLYLKLMKNAAVDVVIGSETTLNSLSKAEVHDIVMTYFG